MTLPVPTLPGVLDYFSALVAEDEGLPLVEAAICVAQDEYPDLDVAAVLDQIDRLAGRLRARVPADAPPLQRVRLLNRYFFGELGFAGNVNHYYDADNSHLHRVLATRRGIPITLALLYIELASQVGLTAAGVAFPGHFLVKLHLPQGEAIIDPFDGRSLSREELNERLEPLRRQQGLQGEFEAPLGLFLQPATARDTLARLLRNLKEIHAAAEDWPRLLAVQERLVRLLPDLPEERRDRGLVWAALGQAERAAADLLAYLDASAGAADRDAVQRRLAELRDDGPTRLH